MTCFPLPPQAFARGLRYPRYMFLTYGWYSNQWWEVDTESLGCSSDDRASVLANTLSLLYFDFLQHFDLEAPTDTGIVSCWLLRAVEVSYNCLHFVEQ